MIFKNFLNNSNISETKNSSFIESKSTFLDDSNPIIDRSEVNKRFFGTSLSLSKNNNLSNNNSNFFDLRNLIFQYRRFVINDLIVFPISHILSSLLILRWALPKSDNLCQN